MKDFTMTQENYLRPFLQGTQDAEFLFGKDIVDYRDSLFDRVNEMRSLQITYRPLPVGEKRTELREKADQIHKDLTNEIRRLPEVFGPYMRCLRTGILDPESF
jgi:hypothetical protein